MYSYSYLLISTLWQIAAIQLSAMRVLLSAGRRLVTAATARILGTAVPVRPLVVGALAPAQWRAAAECASTFGSCAAVGALCAVACCDADPGELDAPLFGVEGLIDVATECNTNLKLMLPKLIARAQAELPAAAGPAKAAEFGRRFDELHEKVKDSVLRNRGATADDINRALSGMVDAQVTQEQADRFASTMGALQALRETAIEGADTAGEEPQGQHAALSFETTLVVLTETIQGMTQVMGGCVKEYSAVGDGAEEAIDICAAARNELLSAQIERRHGLSGEDLTKAFEVHGEDPAFQIALAALLQEQRAQFAEWGLGSADDGQMQHDQGEGEDSNA